VTRTGAFLWAAAIATAAVVTMWWRTARVAIGGRGNHDCWGWECGV
jgi:hypothetical protein